MAKFEGSYPALAKDSPSWFKDFFNNYFFVIKFLNQAGKRGLNFTDNLITNTITKAIKHNTTSSVPHGLGIAPIAVLPQGGRIESYKILSVNNTTVNVIVRLLSSQIMETGSYNAINNILVLDGSLFSVGDEVIIQEQKRKITAVLGNRISLDLDIRFTPPAVITLNSENITFLLY